MCYNVSVGENLISGRPREKLQVVWRIIDCHSSHNGVNTFLKFSFKKFLDQQFDGIFSKHTTLDIKYIEIYKKFVNFVVEFTLCNFRKTFGPFCGCYLISDIKKWATKLGMCQYEKEIGLTLDPYDLTKTFLNLVFLKDLNQNFFHETKIKF